VCTVVISIEPGERMPLLLLGVRDELTGRPWRPPARHWPGSPLVGGLDEQAGGTWLAVNPGVPRVAALLNGRGPLADQARRRSRGELPLFAAAAGGASAGPRPENAASENAASENAASGNAASAASVPQSAASRGAASAGAALAGAISAGAVAESADVIKELAADPLALAAYDPFHLVVAGPESAALLTWDGTRAAARDLAPGTHLLTNAGHAYPADPAHPDDPDGEPKAAHFASRFAASRPCADPALTVAEAWGDWLTLAAGDGLAPADPRAIIARKDLPDGQVWGSTSVTLVGLAFDGLRYDFQATPGTAGGWHPVIVT
jgi:hypothetical protein